MRMLHFVICGLPVLLDFSTLSHKRHDFRKKKKSSVKCVFWFSPQLLSEVFLILRIIEGATIINIYIGLDVKYLLCVSNFNVTWKFGKILENTQTSNVMKMRPVGIELFCATRQTDMTKLVVTFRFFANSPKREYGLFLMRIIKFVLSRKFESHSSVSWRAIFVQFPFSFLFSCLTRWIANVTSKQSEQTCHSVGDLFYTCNSWGLDSDFLPYFVISEKPVTSDLTKRKTYTAQYKLTMKRSIGQPELCGNRLPECYIINIQRTVNRDVFL